MLTRILRSQDGRLALWLRLVGYFILWVFVMGLTNQIRIKAESVPGGPDIPLTSLYVLGFGGGILAVTYLWRRLVDRRPWSGLALLSPLGRWQDLLVGARIAVGMLLVELSILSEFGWVRVVGLEADSVGWASALAAAATLLLGWVPVGLCEELLFRGYLFSNLTERFAVWKVTMGIGLFFGLLHVEHATSLSHYGLIILGGTAVTVFLILTRLVTGSLWMAVSWHVIWNWTASHVLGIYKAGGDFDHALLHLGLGGTVTPVQYDRLSMLLETGLHLLGILALFLWAKHRGIRIDWRSRCAPQ